MLKLMHALFSKQWSKWIFPLAIKLGLLQGCLRNAWRYRELFLKANEFEWFLTGPSTNGLNHELILLSLTIIFGLLQVCLRNTWRYRKLFLKIEWKLSAEFKQIGCLELILVSLTIKFGLLQGCLRNSWRYRKLFLKEQTKKLEWMNVSLFWKLEWSQGSFKDAYTTHERIGWIIWKFELRWIPGSRRLARNPSFRSRRFQWLERHPAQLTRASRSGW